MRILLAILTTSMLLGQQARGCGVCNAFLGNPLALSHPKAIEIAVATRAAFDKGLLRQRAPVPPWMRRPGLGWDNREKPSGAQLLKAWSGKADEPKTPSKRGPHVLHIVLIDMSENYAVHFRGGTALLEQKNPGPGDAVVATTYATLQALLSGEIRLKEAAKSGLVVIEGDRSLVDRLSDRRGP